MIHYVQTVQEAPKDRCFIGITVKQVLSVMDKMEMVAIVNDACLEGEYEGTVGFLLEGLSEDVLNSVVRKIFAGSYYLGTKYGFYIYREVRK